VFGFVTVRLNPRTDWTNEGMGVGVNVGSAIVEGSAPGAMVEEDGVASPTEACSVPAEVAKRRAYGDDWTEADGASDEEARARRVEDDGGAVDGDVVEGWVDGLDLDGSVVFYDVVVGVGSEIAVVFCLLAHALDCVHDVGPLAEDGVAEIANPLRITGHGVEDGGEGQESENAGVPGQVVRLDGLSEGVAGEPGVLLGPGSGLGDLVGEGGCREDLGEKRVRVECDALDELVKLLRRHWRRWRPLLLVGWGSLLLILGLTLLWILRLTLLRVLRLRLLGVLWLALLLIGRRCRRSLANDGGLGESGCSDCEHDAENERAGIFHGFFLFFQRRRERILLCENGHFSLPPFGTACSYADAGLGGKVVVI
jgi:hypothetical protein